MRRSIHILFAATFLSYCVLAALPPSALWFDPKTPFFSDAPFGSAPTLTYGREIKITTTIRYSAVVRDAETRQVVCEGSSGPFRYLPDSGPVVSKDLVWWVAGDPRCALLPPGIYWVSTEWTLTRPLGDLLPEPLDAIFGWIIPPKRVGHESPPFTITERNRT